VDQEHLTPFEAFDLSVTRAGGQSALARIVGCTPGNINQLLQKKRQMPAEFVLRAEFATGVSRSFLRPDIYPPGLQDGQPFRMEPLEAPLVAWSDDDDADESGEILQRSSAA
jgi:DNA-binding transcriptional regulator YdaS (Cro superfamily)